MASHFYELAARALDLFDEDEIVDVLVEVRDRFHFFMHMATYMPFK